MRRKRDDGNIRIAKVGASIRLHIYTTQPREGVSKLSSLLCQVMSCHPCFSSLASLVKFLLT